MTGSQGSANGRGKRSRNTVHRCSPLLESSQQGRAGRSGEQALPDTVTGLGKREATGSDNATPNPFPRKPSRGPARPSSSLRRSFAFLIVSPLSVLSDVCPLRTHLRLCVTSQPAFRPRWAFALVCPRVRRILATSAGCLWPVNSADTRLSRVILLFSPNMTHIVPSARISSFGAMTISPHVILENHYFRN